MKGNFERDETSYVRGFAVHPLTVRSVLQQRWKHKVGKKDRGSRQVLSSRMSFKACDSIYGAACLCEDERVVMDVQPAQSDLIAKEIKYHRACYAKYCKPKTLNWERSVNQESVRSCGTMCARAFSVLAKSAGLSPWKTSDGNVVTSTMPYLWCQFVDFLRK